MKHLYFVRHGLSVMNQQGVFSGRTDTPLTSEGIAQCHEAGRALREAHIDLIVASPIKRTLHSAEIIAEELGMSKDAIITSELFVERSFGPLEGTPYASNANLDDTEGVEHSSQLIARAAQGLAFLQTLDADNILIVSHSAVGRALRHLAQPTVPFHKTKKFANAEIEQLL